MISLTKSQEFSSRTIFGFLLAFFISYLIIYSNFIHLIGILSILFILIITFVFPKSSLIVLLIIKPFIDLTWKAYFVNLGGVGINSLRIIGFYAFILAVFLNIYYRREKKVFNEKIIVFFIIINLFSFLNATIFGQGSVFVYIDSFLRVVDGYLIYFVFHHFLENENRKIKIILFIWMSTLVVSVISAFVFFSGKYDVDVTQGVTRFAGLYNDPGTPSYVAIFSLVFGTLYLEIKRDMAGKKILTRLIYVITLTVCSLLLFVTITRSAILMLLVFLILWFGIFKRKLLIILPLIVIASFFIYIKNENIKLRLKDEIEFLKDQDFSFEVARSLGTGRVAHWERVVSIFNHDYYLFQKFFGTYKNFAAHNQYLAYLLQVGYLGLLIFMIILAKFFVKLISIYKKNKRAEIFMALTLFTMVCIYGFTGHPFDYTTLLWYLMVLLSFVNAKDFIMIQNNKKLVDVNN